MDRYSIIVKGCGIAARAAARQHSCEPLELGCYNYGSTTFVVAGSLLSLTEWLCEPPKQAPFPVGTLLYYRELNQEE
jgi:hypothetical protein